MRRVRSNGQIKWRGEKIFLSEPSIGEVVGLKQTEHGDAEFYFVAGLKCLYSRLLKSKPGM